MRFAERTYSSGFRKLPASSRNALLDRMARDGQELIRQLVENPSYRAKSDEAVPAEFKVPNEAPHPMFVQVDFGLVRDAQRRNCNRNWWSCRRSLPSTPIKALLAQAYIDVYGLNDPASGIARNYFLSGLDHGFLSRTAAASHRRGARS